MQQRGLAAAGGTDDANELAGLNLKVDVIEGEQALSALGPVTETDIAQADLSDRRRCGMSGTANGDGTQFSAGITGMCRDARIEARSSGNRKLAGKFLNVRAHWIAFRPFSARTWLRRERS